jgi:hypothetical protein
MPLSIRTIPLVLLLALFASAQTPPARTPLEEVRAIVTGVFKAIQDGDREMGLKYFAKKFEYYSPGGTTVPPGGDATGRRWLSHKGRANFIRHINFVHPDVALVVGIWKHPTAQPPHDAGLFDYTVVRNPDGWRIAVMREGFFPATQAVAAPAPTASGAWQTLFDGKSTTEWVSLLGDAKLPSGWRVEDACLMTDPSGDRAAIRTRQAYRNFEMTFEWQVSAKGNSGVKYRLFGQDVFVEGVPRDVAGYEYQVADDDGDPGARVDDRQKSGALYAVVPVSRPAAKPVGEWNQSRILLADDHVEHWLNGIETVRYAIDTPFASPIALQHHNTVVRFRNLKIRALPMQ